LKEHWREYQNIS